MAITPVAGVTGVQPAALLGQVAPTTPASTGVDFASVLGSVDQLQQMQSTSQ